jgi:hypothetical protein
MFRPEIIAIAEETKETGNDVNTEIEREKARQAEFLKVEALQHRNRYFWHPVGQINDF